MRNCKHCGKGTFSDSKGATSCKKCPVRTFQDETGQSFCKPCNNALYEGYTYCPFSLFQFLYLIYDMRHALRLEILFSILHIIWFNEMKILANARGYFLNMCFFSIKKKYKHALCLAMNYSYRQMLRKDNCSSYQRNDIQIRVQNTITIDKDNR